MLTRPKDGFEPPNSRLAFSKPVDVQSRALFLGVATTSLDRITAYSPRWTSENRPLLDAERVFRTFGGGVTESAGIRRL